MKVTEHDIYQLVWDAAVAVPAHHSDPERAASRRGVGDISALAKQAERLFVERYLGGTPTPKR